MSETIGKDTTTASIEVLAFEPVAGKGRLLGLAIVELVIDGVEITLQGVKIIRQPDGGLLCGVPTFRHPDGTWLPAVAIPDELGDAIAKAVFAAFGEMGESMGASGAA